MYRAILRFVAIAGSVLPFLAIPAPAQTPAGKVTISVVDQATGKPVACRIHLKNANGKPQRAGTLPFWFDHFVCPGSVQLELPPGEYTYQIECGPEYGLRTGRFTVKEGTPDLKVELERLANLAAEGWWAGELHVHRSVADIELLMRAEDLHVAPVITWWNSRNQWGEQQRLPEKLLNRFDGNRYYHVMAGEDEREGGALMFFNLPRPLPITGAERKFPSPMKFIAEARRQKNVWIDVEKPFWWDVPVWLASGQVDSIGIANNHMCRDKMQDREAWGKPRDVLRLPPPLGNGYWSQEIYYHILNCGLRLPPSAGSASGVLPNPVGYNRVYVHTGKDFTYERWWKEFRAGRCFVTNGPLLRVEAAGHLPGHVFTSKEPVTIDLRTRLTSREPRGFVEIVKNGVVERRIPFADAAKKDSLGEVRFSSSGWFLVRAITDNPTTFHFASTGPYYVEVGPSKSRISRASAQFFLDWARERTQRVKLPDGDQRRAVTAYHENAAKFWQQKVSQANAD